MTLQEYDLCPYCMKHGLRSRIQTYQINWGSAMILCPNPECIFPLDQELSLIDSDGRMRAKGEQSFNEGDFRKVLTCLKDGRRVFPVDLNSNKNTESSSDSSRGVAEYQFPDELNTDFMDDKTLDAYLAGDEENYGDFANFLDYLSNLPNTLYSSFLEVPSQHIPEIKRRQIEVMKVFSPPVMVLNEKNMLSRLPSVIYQRDSPFSFEGINQSSVDSSYMDTTEPRRYVQWSEETNQDWSWLVAGLCAIIHCRVVRNVLKAISKTQSKNDQNNPCITSLVFHDFQLAMRKLFVAKAIHGDSASKACQKDGPGFEYDSSLPSRDYLHFGAECPITIPRPLHQRIVYHLSSCQRRVLKCLQRDSVIVNHPADLIGHLFHSHDSLRDLSVVSFRHIFECSACQYRSVEDRVSRAVNMECPESLSSFSLSGSDCTVEYFCPSCGAVQLARIEWLMVSPILFLHFPKGLPSSCEFEKLRIKTNALNLSKEKIGGIDRYGITSHGQFDLRVSTVVTYETQGENSQYVTWVRRSIDSWMACKESLGKNSHLTEWDPMKAPKSTGMPAETVRILLLEAVPGAQSASANSQQKMTKSRLHERLIDVMRERKIQMMQDSHGEGDSAGATIASTTVMMQRFLNSGVDQKLLMGGKGARFEPYPSDRRSPRLSQSEEVSESSSRKTGSEPCSDLGTKSLKAATSLVHSKSSGCLNNRSKMSRQRRHRLEFEAMSLWPITAKSPSEKSPTIQQIVKTCMKSEPSSDNSKSPVEPVTFNLDATTSFLFGQSTELCEKSEETSNSFG